MDELAMLASSAPRQCGERHPAMKRRRWVVEMARKWWCGWWKGERETVGQRRLGREKVGDRQLFR
jgi:hypothetical protein